MKSQLEHGSLHPVLHQLKHQGWITSKWETSDRGREMKFYRLTAAGRKQLTLEESKGGSNWRVPSRG